MCNALCAKFFLFILKRHILILSIFFIFVVFKKFGIRFGFCEACLSFLVFSKIEQSNQSTVTLSPGHFPVISLFWVQVVCFLERSRFNLSVIKPFVLFNQMSKKSILFFQFFLEDYLIRVVLSSLLVILTSYIVKYCLFVYCHQNFSKIVLVLHFFLIIYFKMEKFWAVDREQWLEIIFEVQISSLYRIL